ncbi:serine/threonine protein kinase [Frankia sp. CcI49]|uniref:WD40 repeat domain-containing serine/threonine protein kinase n=1 Tax=Frankia sp. CcI49 TaxID=1745382 RepID=UPI0009768818|nr:serine/threonine-protein kinase [Frankia sp. CcI49]ONH60153.1 serine/threonine protein kinase [Frankia sp. CcI49]
MTGANDHEANWSNHYLLANLEQRRGWLRSAIPAAVKARRPEIVLGPELGSGGYGLVLEATQKQLNRRVAVKGILGATDEAQRLAELNHPHVVQVYDSFSQIFGQHHLQVVVMEYLPGATLNGRRERLSPEQSCAVGLAVAAGLNHAHQRLLHRDIKPANIMFAEDNTLKVGDFGLAKSYVGQAVHTDNVVGTQAYMAPEQITAGKLTPATDIYALGVVLYQLLTGQLPFGPKGNIARPETGAGDQPPAMGAVDDRIARVVLRTLARRPGDRYSSAAELALALAHAATDAYGPGWADKARTGLPLHLTDLPELIEILRPTGPNVIRTPRLNRSDTSRGSDPRALGAPLRGHEKPVHAVAFSPRGKILASAGADQRIQLWDLTAPVSPRPLGGPLQGHDGTVLSLAFSPSGSILASAGADRTVQLWRPTGPTALRLSGRRPLEHAGQVSSVAFSPNGRILASGSRDTAIRLWDVTDPTAPRPVGEPLLGHQGSVCSLAFSRSGRILASGGADQRIRLWDLTEPTNPQLIHDRLGNQFGQVDAVAFSRRRDTLAGASAGATRVGRATVTLWDVADPADPRPLSQPMRGRGRAGVNAMAFSPVAEILAAAAFDNVVRLWHTTNPAAPQPLGEPLRGHTDRVRSVAFGPQGDILASAGEDGTVRLWTRFTTTAPPQRG